MSMIGTSLADRRQGAILLIDFAKWGREARLDRRTALIEAGGSACARSS